MKEGGRESDGRGRNEGEGRGGGRGKEWEGGGWERWKRERRGRDGRGRGRERWMGSLSPMSVLGAGRCSCTFVCARCSFVDGHLHGDHPGGSWLSMGVVSSSMGAQCSWVGRGCPWALDVHGWGVMVVNVGECRLWVLDTCGWVVVVIDRGVGCVVSRLWLVEVIRGGSLPSICEWSYSVVAVWVMFILVGGCCPWVLVVEGGVVVGDDGGVVIVFPHRPGMWAFIVLKVAVDVAGT